MGLSNNATFLDLNQREYIRITFGIGPKDILYHKLFRASHFHRVLWDTDLIVLYYSNFISEHVVFLY